MCGNFTLLSALLQKEKGRDGALGGGTDESSHPAAGPISSRIFSPPPCTMEKRTNQVPRSTLKSHPRQLCFPAQHFLLANFSAKNLILTILSTDAFGPGAIENCVCATAGGCGQIWNRPVCAVAKYLA
jgi:hypothetical protein